MYVEQNDVRLMLDRVVERLLTGRRAEERVPLIDERALERLETDRIVVDDNDHARAVHDALPAARSRHVSIVAKSCLN